MNGTASVLRRGPETVVRHRLEGRNVHLMTCCPVRRVRGVGLPPVSAQMSNFEAAAFARMLDEALARHLRERDRVPVRLPRVTSYTRLAAMLREWETTMDAVLLRDSGRAFRVFSVAGLQGEEPWPPQGVLAAADGTWVLEDDWRVTRLY